MNDNQVLYKKFRCVLKFIKANTFKHLILKYDIESFDESGYKKIGDIWGNIREGSKIVIQNLGVVKLSDQNHKENVETILEDAELLNFIDFSTNSIEDGDDLETLFGDSGWNLNKTFLEFNSFRSYLKSVRLAVNFFVKTLPKVKVNNFHHVKTENKDTEADFDKYIKIGDASRASPNYRNSNIYISWNNYCLTEENIPNDVNIDKSFIALVAPSLTGKTQSAFTINKIRPLYFNLGDLDIENQPIYLKFKGLSKAVKEAAEEDLESLKSKFKNPNWKNFTNEDKTLYNISSNSLEENFMESKFLTLGLLIKLIEDSELDEKGELRDGKNWMKFHAERNSFSYSAKSIKDLKDLGSEFLEKIRTKYYLFLDEFIGDFWAIFIRNLARCLQIGVVVANTNSNIANLIGKIHSNVSRGSGKWPVWSFVVVRLDLTDWEILNNCSCAKISQKLTDKIKLIIENSNDFNVDGGEVYNIEEMLSNLSVCPSKLSKLVLFFRDFIKNEITKVRPGIAFLIADYIMNFELKLNVDLSKFIDELINEVKKRVEVRKVGKTRGIMGNLALYLSNMTIIKDGVEHREHRKSYLNDHLYYLNNPANEIDWMFLTFFSFGSGKNLRIHQKGTGSISNYTCEWKYELTYFDESELFTVLICLFIKSEHSVAYDLEQGYIDIDDTLKQDILMTISIIDASHRKNGSLTASLSGQNGINFIKNVIGNIIRDENYLRSKEIYLKFPESTLEKVLENCRIPFLYPANLEIPQFLKRLTDEGTIKVGYCQRTSDEDKIDFKFAFEYMNSSCSPTKKIKTSPKYLDARRNIKKYYAVAECKNWTRPLNSKDLIKILEKSFAHKESFLSLLFCNEIEKSVKMNLALKNFCLENGILLYKLALVSKDQPLSFTIESVHDHKLLNSSLKLPEMICIIFETKTINNE